MRIRDWIEATRPRTLPAAIAPVVAGTAAASAVGEVRFWPFFWCLGFALWLQIGTNFANDYYDWKKGADRPDRQGPTRATAKGLVAPKTMRTVAFGTFALAFLWGLPLVIWGGWVLLPLGVVCVLAGLAYTAGPFPLAYNGLGDLFVFIFFGLVAVNGTAFVQTGSFHELTLMISLGVGFLAANILLINNYRDRQDDAQSRKHTLVVLLGARFARLQFALQGSLATGGPILLALITGQGSLALPGLLLPWIALQIRALHQNPPPAQCNQLLGATGQTLALYGLLWIPATWFL